MCLFFFNRYRLDTCAAPDQCVVIFNTGCEYGVRIEQGEQNQYGPPNQDGGKGQETINRSYPGPPERYRPGQEERLYFMSSAGRSNPQWPMLYRRFLIRPGKRLVMGGGGREQRRRRKKKCHGKLKLNSSWFAAKLTGILAKTFKCVQHREWFFPPARKNFPVNNRR